MFLIVFTYDYKKQKATTILETLYKHSKEGKDARYVDNLEVKSFVIALVSKLE